jgi:hypothetical protein
MKSFNSLKFELKYFINKFVFFRAMFSPFIRLTIDVKFGDIQWGTPYFLPRKWVKCNYEDAHEAWNEMSTDTQTATINKHDGISNYFKYYVKSFTKPVTTKIFNIQFVTLGWKTKWDDIRFEWNPMLSIVLFGKQLVIYFDSYWEAWLTYRYRTNKKLSTKERLFELFKQYSCTWTSHEQGKEPVKTDYYYQILKPKYLVYYEEYKLKPKEIEDYDN